MKKFNTVIFDLDGVLIDSKKNMRNSWQKVKDVFLLSQSFNEYFRFVGYPFEIILNKLGIFQNIKRIKELYAKESIRNVNYIKIHNGVIETIRKLKKNKINIGIVTSKDLKRTKIILKKLKIPIETIICPKKKLKGKPFPDQLLLATKKLMSSKNKTCYVGDMYVDYQAAKNARIGFIFAKYGYGKKKSIFKNIIKKPKEILKFTL